jgi:small ligand-binding sensory domain FIST
MTDEMKWVSVLSTKVSLEAAVNEVVAKAVAALAGHETGHETGHQTGHQTSHEAGHDTEPQLGRDAAPQLPSADLGFIFISSMFASEYPRLLPLLREKILIKVLIGCGGEGIIGGVDHRTREVEEEPAIALCLAYLPEVQAQAFWISEEDLPDLDSPPQGWIDRTGIDPQLNPQFVLLSDPLSSGINDLLQGLDFAYPGAVKIGGLASGGSNRGSGLFCNDEYYDEGTVGVALSGKIVLKPIVSQGCRPIGPVFRVAEGERNIILKVFEGEAQKSEELTPLDALQTLLRSLSEDDRELAQNSLFIGLAHSEFQMELKQGDFLIRNLLGIDPRMGAVAVGDRVRVGQRLQFHLRDSSTSADDLELLLKRHKLEENQAKPFGALMFACLGRGEELYNEPDYDSQIFSQYFGSLPVTGFFCSGEIGPISGSTYLHGYTSVFGIACQP